ncbi:MAG: LEA type 2 family protein [Archangium sp.]|nr:LEA type 2 family protein [Archangium sp.]
MEALVRRALLLLFLVTGSGCALLRDLLKSSFRQPSFSFTRVVVSDVTLGGLTLDTVWALNNPNAVAISLASVDYALFVDGHQVVAGAPKQGLNIAANGVSELHFPTQLSFLDVAQVLEVFLTRDTAHWKAEGRIGVQTPIGVLRFPLAKEGDFEVPKRPAVAFGEPRVSNFSLQGVTIEFPLNVTNRSSYALPVGVVSGSLRLAGAPVGTLSTPPLGALEGRGTKQVALPLTINFLSAGVGVMRAVQQGRADLTFTAQVESGSARIPIAVQQAVRFVQ